MKKMLAITVGILMIGLVFAAAQDQTSTKSQEKAQIKTGLKAEGATQQNKVQAKPEFRHRNRIAFIDEDGDGINDRAKDHDGDGVPNGQDPDWVKPGDGTGTKAQNKKGASGAAAGTAAGYAYQLVRDDDGDGVPNGQDPDWVKPEDGSGYKGQHQNARPDETEMTKGQKAGQLTKASFGKGSFRTGTQGAGRMSGAGVCDGSGPKGTARKKGGR
jgi:hypothetical protein